MSFLNYSLLYFNWNSTLGLRKNNFTGLILVDVRTAASDPRVDIFNFLVFLLWNDVQLQPKLLVATCMHHTLYIGNLVPAYICIIYFPVGKSKRITMRILKPTDDQKPETFGLIRTVPPYPMHFNHIAMHTCIVSILRHWRNNIGPLFPPKCRSVLVYIQLKGLVTQVNVRGIFMQSSSNGRATQRQLIFEF